MLSRDPAVDAIVVKYGRQYPNCAQTSFLSMRERNNLQCDESSFVHALTGFPAIGGTGETCGAVSGPLLALGLALAPTDPADKEQTAKCQAAARQFVLAVKQEYGSTRCPDIVERCCGTRYDLSKPQEAKKYAEAGGLQKCLNVVQTSVNIATRILEGAATGGGESQPH